MGLSVPEGLRRLLRVLGALGRVALMSAATYRASFLLDVFTGAITSVGLVLPLVFVYGHASTVAGWSLHEALLVTAFFLVLQGLIGAFVDPNLGAIVEGIRTGALDHLVLKPADAQLVAGLQRLAPARLWDVLAGIGLGVYALSKLPTPTPGQFMLAAALLACGLAAMIGIWVLVTCSSFWFVRVDNLRFLLSSAMDTGRWPVTVYRGWLRTLLTVVLPVALVTSFPAMALLGRMEPGLVLQAAAVGLGLLALSRWAWVSALAHYTSASS
jgi:ABC-2 type transport system permease protein